VRHPARLALHFLGEAQHPLRGREQGPVADQLLRGSLQLLQVLYPPVIPVAAEIPLRPEEQPLEPNALPLEVAHGVQALFLEAIQVDVVASEGGVRECRRGLTVMA